MKLRSSSKLLVGTLSLVLVAGLASLRAGLVSPDGKLVAYAVPGYDADGNYGSQVLVRASDGSSPRLIGVAGGARDQVTWLGNDRVAVSEFHSGRVFEVFAVEGGRLPEITLPAEDEVLYLALSPDGGKLTFTGTRKTEDKGTYGLFVYDTNGHETKLLIEKTIRTLAAWSPDSRKLALGTGVGYTKDHPLEIVDAATGQVEDTGARGVGACWSPDGTLIACTTEVQRNKSYFAGVPTGGKLGLYHVSERRMRVIEGSDGAIRPAWSKSGRRLAYLAEGKLGIARADGSNQAAPQAIEGGPIPSDAQLGWVGDEAVYLGTKRYLARFDVAAARAEMVAQWGEPRAPELKPDDFKVVELPRVTVRYARFDRPYAEALGRILEEALQIYESRGFKMPAKATLEAQIDPERTQLWTDGESQMFLHLKSKELLAPASRTGVFNLYGMCHELGHIAMYRNLSTLMGLPAGVGEGWADYAGKVVVTEVAARLGKSIWPEYYDVAEVEGIGRMRRDAAKHQPWEQLEADARVCLVFYRIETEYGRDKVAAAMTTALAGRPTGKALMPLVLAKLRAATGDPQAGAWAPECVLVPKVEWKTRERIPGDDFFAEQKIEPDGPGRWLAYDGGTMSDKRSMAGAAEIVLFRQPEGAWQLDGLKLFGARYGNPAPPAEDISIYVCDETFEVVREVTVPYAKFQRGAEKWQEVSFPAVDVPRTFYLAVDFHATAQKGVYVGLDKSVNRSHSRIGMPYAEVSDLQNTADWMIRARLAPKP